MNKLVVFHGLTPFCQGCGYFSVPRHDPTSNVLFVRLLERESRRACEFADAIAGSDSISVLK